MIIFEISVRTTTFITATDYISSKYFDSFLMQCPTALAALDFLLSYERDPVRSWSRHASAASNGMHSPIRFALISDGRGTGCQAEKSKRHVLASPPPAAAEPTYQQHISRLHNRTHPRIQHHKRSNVFKI